MLRLLSIVAALPLALIFLGGVALYTAYGEVDPCRVLAVERTRQAEAETGVDIARVVEPWMRFQTSQLSTGQCARELAKSWKTRMWHEEKAENHDNDHHDDYADNPDDRVGDYGNNDYSSDDFGSDYQDNNSDEPGDSDEPHGD